MTDEKNESTTRMVAMRNTLAGMPGTRGIHIANEYDAAAEMLASVRTVLTVPGGDGPADDGWHALKRLRQARAAIARLEEHVLCAMHDPQTGKRREYPKR